MMRSYLVLFVSLNIAFVAYAAKIETNETNVPHVAEKSSNPTALVETKTAASSTNPSYLQAPSFFSSEFWRSGVGQALSIGGMVATTLAVLGGLTWLFAPFFGLRMCNLLGNCEKSAIAYNNGGNLQDPNLQNDVQYMNPYNNIQSYYKRSVDVFGPIIKKFASAVDKYEKITDNNGSTS